MVLPSILLSLALSAPQQFVVLQPQPVVTYTYPVYAYAPASTYVPVYTYTPVYTGTPVYTNPAPPSVLVIVVVPDTRDRPVVPSPRPARPVIPAPSEPAPELRPIIPAPSEPSPELRPVIPAPRLSRFADR
jgi:hypothetical protein